MDAAGRAAEIIEKQNPGIKFNHVARPHSPGEYSTCLVPGSRLVLQICVLVGILALQY